MKTLCIICLNVYAVTASAQNPVDFVTSHTPIYQLNAGARPLCEAELFAMSLDPQTSIIKNYENCVDQKKKNISDLFINANKHLKEKGYTEAVVSLRKYYNSIIQRLAEPVIYSRESIRERSIRDRRDDELRRATDVAWSELATDIKMADKTK